MSEPAKPDRSRRRWILLGLVGGIAALAASAPSIITRVVSSALNQTIDADFGTPSPAASELHATLRIADLHADALLWDRSLLARARIGHVDLPRLREGRVAIQAFTAVTKTPADMNIEANAGDSDQITTLAIGQAWPPRTWSSLAERAIHQAKKLERASSRSNGDLVVVRDRPGLTEVLDARRRAPAADAPVAAFLGIEGAHALEGDLENVDRLFEAGYRMFGLTHFFDNEVGGSAHGVDKGGLTDFGAAVLDRMAQLGIAIDLAHAAPRLIDDVLARNPRPILVSHTGVKGTCDNRRNLDDSRLAAIAATGGVVGIGLWDTAICGETPAHWAAAVRHAVDVMGIDHVAVGSDWDGAVTTIIDAAGTVHLVDALMAEGFSNEDIEKVMGGNVERVLLDLLPERTVADDGR